MNVEQNEEQTNGQTDSQLSSHWTINQVNQLQAEQTNKLKNKLV